MLRPTSVWPVAFLMLGVAACEPQDAVLPVSPPPSAAATVVPPSPPSPAAEQEGAARPWVAAAERGVTFRAVGNEPGWLLEIAPEGLRLLTQYGTDSLHASTLERTETGDTLRFAAHADDHAVWVEAVRTPCEDVMSGKRHDYAVRVTVDDAAYSGCGMRL